VDAPSPSPCLDKPGAHRSRGSLKLRVAHGVAQHWRNATALLLTQLPPPMARIMGALLRRPGRSSSSGFTRTVSRARLGGRHDATAAVAAACCGGPRAVWRHQLHAVVADAAGLARHHHRKVQHQHLLPGRGNNGQKKGPENFRALERAGKAVPAQRKLDPMLTSSNQTMQQTMKQASGEASVLPEHHFKMININFILTKSGGFSNPTGVDFSS